MFWLNTILLIIVSLGISIATSRTSKNLVTPQIISWFTSIQLILLVLFLIASPNANVINDTYAGLSLRGTLHDAYSTYLVYQLGILLSTTVLAFYFSGYTPVSIIREVSRRKNHSIEVFLFCSAVVFGSYPFFIDNPVFGYFIRVYYNFFQFAPLLAGLYYGRNRLISFSWLFALSLLLVTGMLSGGRNTAFFSSLLYFIGMLFSSKINRKKLLVFGTVLIIPTFFLMSVIGQVRTYFKRGMEDLTLERAINMYNTYSELSDRGEIDITGQVALTQTLGRFINWPNLTVINIVPARKDHIKFDDILSVDLKYTFDIAFLSGTTKEDRVKAKYANYRLKDFGYKHLYESYSVEYSVLADGYLRFGYLGVFLFIYVWSGILMFVELFAKTVLKKDVFFGTIISLVIYSLALKTNVYSIFPQIKTLILGLFLAFFSYSVLIPALKFFLYKK